MAIEDRVQFEIRNAPYWDGHPMHYPANPDLHFPNFAEIDFDEVADLGVDHVATDYDGVLLPIDSFMREEIPPETTAALARVVADTRFVKVVIATDSARTLIGNGPEIPQGVDAVFNTYDPDEGVRLPGKDTHQFWYRLLTGLDLFEEPHRLAMIGDNGHRDIEIPQSLGIRTVQVDPIFQSMKRVD